MKMIERVARALALDDGANYTQYTKTYLSMSRAAIEAMRKPTELQVTRGYESYGDRLYFGPTQAENCWNSMVDAALKESND